MSYKSIDETLRKAGETEPIFVLRAQDRLAPEVVRFWCLLAEKTGVPLEKVEDARGLASAMDQWGGTRKFPD